MNEKMKDKLTEVCDDKDWRLEFTSNGCIIKTHNGAQVEYQEDTDDRTVTVRAEGRFRTVLSVLRIIEQAQGNEAR